MRGYSVAGHAVAADLPNPYLEPFPLTGSSAPQPTSYSLDRLPSPAEMRLVYQSHVWADEAWRAFTCRHHPHGFWLEVQGIGCFAVDAAGQAVTCTVRAEGAPLDAVIQAATGAPLMLALALRGTWSLHASAALIHGKLAAFAADSGTGKSTLARTLDEMGARRAADDILPVTLDEGQGHAWPHFPQLKLPLDRQPGLGLPERLPLHTLYQLDPTAPPDSDLTPVPLPPRDAAAVILRHTVAARLFDAALLRRHFDFATQMARHLRVCRLPYPRRFDTLPAVCQHILADMQRFQAPPAVI